MSVRFDALPIGALRRFPPARDIPRDDGSLLRALYHRIPFPNTEWWWQCLHLRARSDAGDTREFSVVVNVQLSGALVGPEPRPVAMCAVRDLTRGADWCSIAAGHLSDDASARFLAPGWHIARAEPTSASYAEQWLSLGASAAEAQRFPEGLTGLSIDSDVGALELTLGCRASARIGTNGWLDYDPAGPFPLWASNKIRMHEPSGWLTVGGGDRRRFHVTGGTGHYDHQCLLPTARVPHLAGALLQREGIASMQRALRDAALKWHWYLVVLGQAHLWVFAAWSTATGRVLKSFGVLLNQDGRTEEVRDLTLEPRAYYEVGGVSVPRRSTIEFRAERAIESGDYRVDLVHDAGRDWLVPYLLPLDTVCLAHEACCETHVERNGVELEGDWVANQETIDFVRSVRKREEIARG